MVEKTISGSVADDQGNTLGNVSGTYIDEYLDQSTEQIISRQVTITVADDQSNTLGNGTLTYDDYISYNGGGTRTITLSGNVVDEQNNTIGSISGSLEDEYGSVKIPTVITLEITPL